MIGRHTETGATTLSLRSGTDDVGDGLPVAPNAPKVRLRPIGGQDYEVRRGRSVEGIAHFERYHTKLGVTVRAWIERPGQEIVYLNPGYFEDFAKTVRRMFG